MYSARPHQAREVDDILQGVVVWRSVLANTADATVSGSSLLDALTSELLEEAAEVSRALHGTLKYQTKWIDSLVEGAVCGSEQLALAASMCDLAAHGADAAAVADALRSASAALTLFDVEGDAVCMCEVALHQPRATEALEQSLQSAMQHAATSLWASVTAETLRFARCVSERLYVCICVYAWSQSHFDVILIPAEAFMFVYFVVGLLVSVFCN